MTSPDPFVVLNIINTDQVPKKKRVANIHDFIARAREVHGDRYDYSKVIYLTSQKKVIIICYIHGEFTQTPSCHLKGSGCAQCGNIKRAFNCRLTRERFIEKAVAVHGDKYTYNRVIYTTNRVKVILICPIHGEFSQLPQNHLRGRGCPKYTQDEFIVKVREAHGDKYIYDLVTYVGANHYIQVICRIHGVFLKRAVRLLNGGGCAKCAYVANALKMRLTPNEYILKARQVHGDRYDYINTIWSNYLAIITVICRLHGEFQQITSNHIRGAGCPICKASHGERDITQLLDSWRLKYISQYYLSGYMCRYDFQVAYFLIEYDGSQHFKQCHFHKS